MSWRKFKFVSPGIFINEIDNSQLTEIPGDIGPAVIGRARRGPGMKPVLVNSFSDFVETFGNPIPGGQGGDVWRDGNLTAPAYATYAAQAWLRNNSPLTFFRLLGKTHSEASVAGYAGWKTTNIDMQPAGSDNGGAFGLFIVEGTGASDSEETNSGQPTTLANFQTGTLAAVWYLNDGAIALSGNDCRAVGTAAATAALGVFVKPVDTSNTFKVIIEDSSGNEVINAPFDFTPTSPRFVRKVFNTNPTTTNSDIVTDSTNYWLGESYEGSLEKSFDITGSAVGEQFGIILPLGSPDGAINGGDFRMGPTKKTNGVTGWFFSQDLGTSGSFQAEEMQKLFRFVTRDGGEDIQKTVKISLSDIKRSTDPFNPYGSFTVFIRNIKDTDNAPIVLEQYNNCNLNPASDNYIAKKIGDTFLEWSDTDRRYTEYGNYPNVSRYVRVEMNADVDKAVTNDKYLPFGVYGPPRYKGFALSGSKGAATNLGVVMIAYGDGTIAAEAAALTSNGTFVQSGTVGPLGGVTIGTAGTSDNFFVAAKYRFPELRLRISSSEGVISDPQDAYFGVDTTYNGTRFNDSVIDVLRTKADDISGQDIDTNYTEYSWIFTLDDVRNELTTGSFATGPTDYTGAYGSQAVYESGSRVNGLSYTAHTASSVATPAQAATASYINVLDAGFDSFTTCIYGGADGLDIKEREPFNNTRALGAAGVSETNSAEYNSLRMAIDTLRDPERTEFNLVSMPGITNNPLNDALIKMCEARGDAMAIVDLQGGYKPSTENTDTVQNRLGSVSDTITNLRNNLSVNSSYGCAYYPWVQIRDTINGATLWAPPSVAALGAMSYGQATSQLWFAPAGFTRGGLSANNAAGIPVVGVRQRLVSKDRDKLYDANINPIAQFPAEGIVIFGQKTLQVTPSALDRINVRRLLIYLKKRISRYAATVLFDQNVQATWNRFRGQVEPFLDNVKSGLGITAYKLVLDASTTTPDLIDRNIMYAKIFIKPARAIEFIAIDFVITDSGASFED